MSAWVRMNDGNYDIAEVERMAEIASVPLCYRRSRCVHGYTREETCTTREHGMASDGSSYALLPDGVVYYAETDDGMDVAYIPARHNDRVKRAIAFA